MLLYSYRMKIEQNFRNEKVSVLVSACVRYSRSAGKIRGLSLLATLSTIVRWLIGYHA